MRCAHVLRSHRKSTETHKGDFGWGYFWDPNFGALWTFRCGKRMSSRCYNEKWCKCSGFTVRRANLANILDDEHISLTYSLTSDPAERVGAKGMHNV